MAISEATLNAMLGHAVQIASTEMQARDDAERNSRLLRRGKSTQPPFVPVYGDSKNPFDQMEHYMKFVKGYREFSERKDREEEEEKKAAKGKTHTATGGGASDASGTAAPLAPHDEISELLKHQELLRRFGRRDRARGGLGGEKDVSSFTEFSITIIKTGPGAGTPGRGGDSDSGKAAPPTPPSGKAATTSPGLVTPERGSGSGKVPVSGKAKMGPPGATPTTTPERGPAGEPAVKSVATPPAYQRTLRKADLNNLKAGMH
jgi:hypothetical protein